MSLKDLKCRGVFVTGTDTSVGKTMLAAGLTGLLCREGVNVGVMKPVASGAIECDSGKLISQDAEMLVKFSASDDPWELINPYCLAAPVVPALAAKIEGISIDFDKIKQCFDQIASKHDFVVVEGAGGLLSPLSDVLVVADLVKLLDLPVIVVSRPQLGTINHTLMTIECLKNRRLKVLGFVVNRFPQFPNLAESTNAEIIFEVSGIPCLGSIPELGDFFSQQDVVDTFAKSIPLERLQEILC